MIMQKTGLVSEVSTPYHMKHSVPTVGFSRPFLFESNVEADDSVTVV